MLVFLYLFYNQVNHCTEDSEDGGTPTSQNSDFGNSEIHLEPLEGQATGQWSKSLLCK